MYRYKLKIFIISKTEQIQKQLEGIKPRERFEHIFATVDRADNIISEGDIFIVDGDESMLEPIYKGKGTDTWVIFYGSPSSYKNLSEVWPKPLDDEGMSFYFNALLDKIKLKKDYMLASSYLDTLIDNTPDLVWFKDAEGSHVKVNNSFCKAVNKTKEQVEGRGHYYIWDITPEDYSKGEYVCLESEDMVMNAKKAMVFDEIVKTKSGMRQFVTTKSPIFNEKNEIMGTVGWAHDVTELKNVSGEMSLFIENIPYGVIITDVNDIIMNVNTAMETITGTPRDTMIGTKANLRYASLVEATEDSTGKTVSVIQAYFCGHVKTIEMTKMNFTDVFKKPMGIIRIFRDITAEKELEKQVIKNANTDYLTGLYNRRYCYEYFDTQCKGKPVSILTLDLDNFKGVNDSFGHDKGDEALILTADILRKNFDEELLVRIGGDEFLVIFTCNDAELIEKKSKALSEELNRAFAARKEFAGVSASIGVAVAQHPDNDINEAVKCSDNALYSVKKNHKGGLRIICA